MSLRKLVNESSVGRCVNNSILGKLTQQASDKIRDYNIHCEDSIERDQILMIVNRIAYETAKVVKLKRGLTLVEHGALMAYLEEEMKFFKERNGNLPGYDGRFKHVFGGILDYYDHKYNIHTANFTGNLRMLYLLSPPVPWEK